VGPNIKYHQWAIAGQIDLTVEHDSTVLLTDISHLQGD
jgi:hypothetical protein